jgi:hypothetical protein
MTDATQTFAAERAARQDRFDAQRNAELHNFIAAAGAAGIIDYTVPIHTADQLHTVLMAIGGHNNYDPQRAVALLSPLIDTAMAVNVDMFSGGPAISFEIPFTRQQQIQARRVFAPSIPIEDTDRIAMAQAIIDAGRALDADSIAVRQAGGHPDSPEYIQGAAGERPREIRLWWD